MGGKKLKSNQNNQKNCIYGSKNVIMLVQKLYFHNIKLHFHNDQKNCIYGGQKCDKICQKLNFSVLYGKNSHSPGLLGTGIEKCEKYEKI